MARPRGFDRARALRDAMEAFWELGYETTSTALLERRMGIQRSSLYAAFGSKDELYAEALEDYANALRARVVDKLRSEGPALRVLEEFLMGVAGRGGPDDEPLRCCMILRASLSGDRLPAQIRTRIHDAISELDDAFYALLQRAAEEGALPAGANLRASARFLTTTYQSLNVAAHAGRSRRELREIVRHALSALR